jgi:hypothetical protein
MQRRAWSQGSTRFFVQKHIRLSTRKKILLLQMQAKNLFVALMLNTSKALF